MLCTYAFKTSSTESILCRGLYFSYIQRKETKSVLLSFLSIFFSLFFFQTPWIWEQPLKVFPISASQDTSGAWAWVHCSVEQGISCCKWRPKSILQAELLTTHMPKNPSVHKRDKEMERRGERKLRLKEENWDTQVCWFNSWPFSQPTTKSPCLYDKMLFVIVLQNDPNDHYKNNNNNNKIYMTFFWYATSFNKGLAKFSQLKLSGYG